MPLNFTQPSLDRNVSNGGFQQALRQLGFPLAAVEAVDELVDVVLQIFAADAVEGAENKSFEIGDDEVHLRQPLGGLIRGRHSGLMGMVLAQAAKRTERIAAQR